MLLYCTVLYCTVCCTICAQIPHPLTLLSTTTISIIIYIYIIYNNTHTQPQFADSAASNSACPSAKKGGSLGSFSPGQMVAAFDKVVFAEDVGVVHGPIATQFGSHLILITDRDE